MTDDIVTRLEKDLFLATKYANSTALVELLNRALEIVRVAEQRKKRAENAEDRVEHWRNIANRLGTHLGEGLYTDDWECREYAIAAYADWERQSDARLYKYDVEPQPVWYFKNGEHV